VLAFFALIILASWMLGQAHAFPVTVESCGERVTFEAAPRRAVIHDINMTEMALALGLQEHLVGVTGITGWYKVGPDFRASLGSIPELSPREPTLESLLAVRPDFFFAGWYYGMKPGGEVTPRALAARGVRTLVLTESCIHADRRRPPATMDLLYDDVIRLGVVFGREARARALVAEWRARIAAARTTISPPLRVFLYDSGEERPFTAGRFAIAHAMIEIAGGQNVMSDLGTSWGHASWEAVALRDPQFLVVLDYEDGASPARALSFMRAHPAMKRTTAIREDRSIALRYAEITPGPANVAAVEKLARALAGLRPTGTAN